MSRGKRAREWAAHLMAAHDDPVVWLGLLDGPSQTVQIIVLPSDKVLRVDPGSVLIGFSRESVEEKVKAMGFTLDTKAVPHQTGQK